MNPSLVLDCLAACGLWFEDEATEASDQLLDLLEESTALVPALFFWEVANVLLMATGRQRLSQAERVEALQLLEAQGFELDPASPPVIWHDGIYWAEQCQLSGYDAASLELAMRRGLPLATHNRGMRAAARSLGVELVFA